MMKVTLADLVQGAWYALEQAGHLLNDAVTLFDLQRYGTALGLAMLGREEFGKARSLFRLAMRGEDVDAAAVKMDDHQDKQTAAVLSVMLPSAGPQTELGRLFQKLGTPDGPEASKAIEKIAQRIGRRLPSDRVAARSQSLYVDWKATGGWARPAEIGADVAMRDLNDAINDYNVYVLKITTDTEAFFGVSVSDLLDRWVARPDLPALQRPNADW